MTSVKHPQRRIPDDVAEVFRKIREEEDAELAHRQELAKLSRPTEEERRALAERYESTGQAPRLGDEQKGALRDFNKRRFDRLQEEITTYHDRIQERPFDPLPPWDFDPFGPHAVHHDFWWAEAQGGATGNFRAFWSANDNLYFEGGPNEYEGDFLLIQSFQAEIKFELQAHRIPESPSSRWISNPYVELWGGLHGHTGSTNPFFPDPVCKCTMERKQTVFQFGLGGELTRGEAREFQTLIDETDESRDVHIPMPGLRNMPLVEVTNINPAQSLWARLMIRFEVQVTLAFVWCDPYVTVRTVQWPLQPA